MRVLSEALASLPHDTLDALLREGDMTEGWILGLGHEAALRAALAGQPMPLKDDCFALPPGVHWTPVDEALGNLKARLGPVVGTVQVPVGQALARIACADITAPRAHPPLPNTAVDGYGFLNGRGEGAHQMSVMAEDMAAGRAPDTVVPAGTAIRILTGAALPQGVDTVILQEDVTVSGTTIRFSGPIKQGANTRKAGEDVEAGDVVVQRGRRVTPADEAWGAPAGWGGGRG